MTKVLKKLTSKPKAADKKKSSDKEKEKKPKVSSVVCEEECQDVALGVGGEQENVVDQGQQQVDDEAKQAEELSTRTTNDESNTKSKEEVLANNNSEERAVVDDVCNVKQEDPATSEESTEEESPVTTEAKDASLSPTSVGTTTSEDDEPTLDIQATPKPYQEIKGEEIDAPSEDGEMVGATPTEEEGAEATEGGDEGYDLIKVLSMKDIINDGIICNGGDQGECEKKLPACVVYANASNPKERWYYCLDCQEADFEGWPEAPEELPVKHLTKEHMDFMKKHCSDEKNKAAIQMPSFPDDAAPPEPTTNTNTPQTMTPVPSQAGKKKGNKVAVGVTPSPHPGAAGATKPVKAPKASNRAVEMHKKWQEEATKNGGGKIVVQKSEAKKKIYDFMCDNFRPYTATVIYNVRIQSRLNCIIFSIVLFVLNFLTRISPYLFIFLFITCRSYVAKSQDRY